MKVQQEKVHKAKTMLQRVGEGHLNKMNKHRVPATHQQADWVLVYHNSLPAHLTLPAMTPTLSPTRSYQWTATTSQCGVLPS